MRYIIFLAACILGILCAVTRACDNCRVPESAVRALGDELAVIDRAAERNDCHGDFRLLLYAIRKAENGGEGKQFGILNPKADNLDKQAGWCAATIRKNYSQWVEAGRPGEYAEFLQRRYCPVGAANDPNGLNANWMRNVRVWYARFGGREIR